MKTMINGCVPSTYCTHNMRAKLLGLHLSPGIFAASMERNTSWREAQQTMAGCKSLGSSSDLRGSCGVAV
jgi:hypothetical protein